MSNTYTSSHMQELSILDSVHAVETALLKGSEVSCESPLCDVRFPQTGLKMEPRRFCSDSCRQAASLIRRVSALLVPLGKEKAWEALKRVHAQAAVAGKES
jgi:hypothetical protein